MSAYCFLDTVVPQDNWFVISDRLIKYIAGAAWIKDLLASSLTIREAVLVEASTWSLTACGSTARPVFCLSISMQVFPVPYCITAQEFSHAWIS